MQRKALKQVDSLTDIKRQQLRNIEELQLACTKLEDELSQMKVC